jgi:hypothetical protein
VGVRAELPDHLSGGSSDPDDASSRAAMRKRSKRQRTPEVIAGPPRTLSPTSLWLASIVVLALVVRVYPVLSSPETARNGFGIFGDTYLYNLIAYNVYMGNGFSGTDYGGSVGRGENGRGLPYEPAVVRPPGYPLFMAAIYAVFGRYEDMLSPTTWHRNLDKVRLAQCVLDALVPLVLFCLVKTIYPASPWPGLIAAALYAVGVYNIFYTRALLSESLTAACAAVATLFSVLGLARKRTLWWGLAGAAWGLVVLCRPEYLPFPFVIAVLACLADWPPRSRVYKSLAAIVVGLTLIVSPWVARNYEVFGKPVVAVGGLGYNLFLGTFETNSNWAGWGTFPDEVFADAREKEAVRALAQAHARLSATGSVKLRDVDDAFLRLALDRIRRDPWESVKTWLIRIPRLWYQLYVPMYRRGEPSGAWCIAYLLLALCALVSARGEERLLMAPAALLCVYVTLIYLPLHVEPRYSVASMPALISLAGIGIWKAGLLVFRHRGATVAAVATKAALRPTRSDPNPRP